jgi:hypothetical protein
VSTLIIQECKLPTQPSIRISGYCVNRVYEVLWSTLYTALPYNATIGRSVPVEPSDSTDLAEGYPEKQRLTLPGPTARALAAWIKVRGDHDGPVFPRLDRQGADPSSRLSGKSVRKII